MCTLPSLVPVLQQIPAKPLLLTFFPTVVLRLPSLHYRPLKSFPGKELQSTQFWSLAKWRRQSESNPIHKHNSRSAEQDVVLWLTPDDAHVVHTSKLSVLFFRKDMICQAKLNSDIWALVRGEQQSLSFGGGWGGGSNRKLCSDMRQGEESERTEKSESRRRCYWKQRQKNNTEDAGILLEEMWPVPLSQFNNLRHSSWTLSQLTPTYENPAPWVNQVHGDWQKAIINSAPIKFTMATGE